MYNYCFIHCFCQTRINTGFIHQCIKLFGILGYKEYGIHYTENDIDNIEIKNLCNKSVSKDTKKKIIIDKREERQRYIFDGLCDKEIEQTNIEKVLDIALKEIDKQEIIKQNIETKAGIVLAFWGVTISSILNILKECIEVLFEYTLDIWVNAIFVILGIGLIVFTFLILWTGYIAFKNRDYHSFILDDEVFRAAVDDRNISIVAILETATNIANRNRVINEEKARKFNILVLSTLGFVVIIFFVSILIGLNQIVF